MPDTGSPYNLPYPDLDDIPDIPSDFKGLADKTHEHLGEIQTEVGEIQIEVTASGVPVGAIMMWATATAPDGWLLCDGTGIDAKYTELIALVGSKTPNMVGRFPLGVKASGYPQATTLGSAAGSWDVAQHNHTQTGHSHNTNDGGYGRRDARSNLKNAGDYGLSSGGGYHSGKVVITSGVGEAPISSKVSNTPAIQNNSTTNTQSKNMPPYLALNFIIKT